LLLSGRMMSEDAKLGLGSRGHLERAGEPGPAA
jgi:hypothetical protein